MRPPRSGATRFSASGAISTRAALTIWRRASPFSPPSSAPRRTPPPPAPVSAFGRFEGACFEAEPGAPHALIVFYRSIYLAGDLAPIEALAQALRDKGFATTSVFVTSLKDEAALEPLRALVSRVSRFDVVLNATAFSARLDEGEGTALDVLDAPVMQVVLAGVGLDAWRASPRGLGPADLAMHVALARDRRANPYPRDLLQGGEPARRRGPSSARSRISRSPTASLLSPSSLAAGRTSGARRHGDKRLACVLPDYPARGGRTGYAVGLDTPASAVAISETLRAAGYDVACDLDAPSLIAALTEGPLEATLTLAEYEAELFFDPAGLQAIAHRRVGRARRRPLT